MKNYVTIVLLVASLVLGSCASVNTAHTPPDGSAERNGILQAVHHALARQGRKNVVLAVPYLKVHNGWAWIQVNPKSADGRQHYESQSGLLQQTGSKWTLLEWMPAEEGTDYTKYFQKLKAKYPSAPPDIFPQ
ncbi:MAG: hypothetical protein ACJ8LL_11325 [Candidatus Udaeobacter sp.]